MLPNKAPTVGFQHGPVSPYEVIDANELAKRWNVPASWIREQTRTRAGDPLPCIRFGRYVRFEWGSPPLMAWYERRRSH